MDSNTENDWSYIEDPNGCDCNVIGNIELAEKLGIDWTGPDYGGGSTGGSGSVVCDCDFELAGAEDIADALNRRIEKPDDSEQPE